MRITLGDDTLAGRRRRRLGAVQHRARLRWHPHPQRAGRHGRLADPAARPPCRRGGPQRADPSRAREHRDRRPRDRDQRPSRPDAPHGPAQGRRPPAGGARARALHLGPLGQRVPAGQGGRVPSARLRDGLVDLPHRPADPEVGREPGADQADRGHVHGPRAGHEPHGGGGRGARGRRRGRRAPRRQLLRVGQRLGRVHRLRHGGQGRGRDVVPQRAGQALHLGPLGAGLLDPDADRATCRRGWSWAPACTTSPTAS